MNKEDSKKIIEDLVQKFSDHLSEYKDKSYNEATLRIDFLNKFFKALGWDVENDEGLPPSYREVITEDAVKVEGKTKSPDYSFRKRNGRRQFFVEAKKPAVNISTHASSAFQLRRYGWNADIGISILSSFEYFAVYDCSSRPKEMQKASYSRLKIIHYEDYINEFDYIWSRFSRDAVHSGSLDEFELAKDKKGSLSVDNDFLKSLDGWRSSLAENIFKNNQIEEHELNHAVQILIDRIIFLRIAEDRNIEQYGSLKVVAKGQNVFEDFLGLCSRANDKYNSGLFKSDSIIENLNIKAKNFSEILEELYFPISPYEFSVLPLDILGKAYEQFLGKVIVVGKKNKLNISEKPEVKKAGGVFYTPKYIVEYIVSETLGKLVEGKNPAEVEKLKVLDPACGSGTFLLTAYEFLLNWYKDYYTNFNGKISKKAKAEIITPTGELTTKFKGKILLDNIYGVDVDRNAIEVTKLSLLLKCLEGESKDSLEAQISLFHERVLPTIDKNIVSGNSLVDFDIYGLSPDLEEDLKIKRKINAFSWNISFKEILSSGGFDVVIGNPPYVEQKFFKEIKDYLSTRFKVYSKTADLYTYFFEKSYDLLNSSGLFSIIVANKWFRTSYAFELRTWLKSVNIDYIKDFGDLPVFKNATTYPCIIKLNKENPADNFNLIDLIRDGIRDPREHQNGNIISIKKSRLNDEGWLLADEQSLDILDFLKKGTSTLKDQVDDKIFRGIITGLNDAFVFDEESKQKIVSKGKKYAELFVPFLKGREVKSLSPLVTSEYLLFIPKGWTIERYGENDEGKAFKKFEKEFPVITKHLKPFEEDARVRWDQGDFWWELRACDYYDAFKEPKIVYPNILKKPEFTFNNDDFFTNQKCYIISTQDLFIVGALNSELAHFWYDMYLPKLRGGFFEPNRVIFKNFPLVTKDAMSKKQLEAHGKIVNCVKKLLSLHEQDETKDVLKEIGYYKQKLDEYVYESYGFKASDVNHISRIVDNVKR